MTPCDSTSLRLSWSRSGSADSPSYVYSRVSAVVRLSSSDICSVECANDEEAHVCANLPTPPSGSDLIRMLLLRNSCIALHGYQLHEKSNTVKPCSHGLTTLSEKFWSGTALTVCHKQLQESLITRGSLSDVSVCVCSLYIVYIHLLSSGCITRHDFVSELDMNETPERDRRRQERGKK